MTIRLREEIARMQRRTEPDPEQERETAGGLTPGNRGAVAVAAPAPWTSEPFTTSAMARDGVPQAEEAVTVRPLELTGAAPGRKGPGAGTPPADPGPTWPQVGSAARPTASHGARGLLPEEAVATPGGAVPVSVPLSVPVSASLSLGPLDASVADPRVGDILVVAPDRVFAEIDGTLTRVPVAFGSDDAVLALAQRIAAPLGRELTVAHPFMDARLDALGLRITATIPPFSRRPTLSLRKTRSIAATQEDLLASGFATEDALELLAKAVRDRQNLIITGPTGAGKTTLARYLARHVPPYERIITVEETYELGLSELHPHVVELETRSGPYAIDADLALRQVLHMRPDRIILGEVRHKEALQLLVAMGTGHRGSWTTLHSDRSEDVFDRLVFAMRLGAPDMPMDALLRYAVRTVNLVVQVGRASQAAYTGPGAQRVSREPARRLEGIFEVASLSEAGQPILRPLYLRPAAEGGGTSTPEGGLRP